MIFRKLFTRKSEEDDVKLHVAGATVRDKNPFENMEVVVNEEELTLEFATKWVAPFYMGFFAPREEKFELVVNATREITSDIITKLLGEFNWRTRITGAYFAAVNVCREFEDTIGTLLLKSEVCYAGGGYCLALASFGTEKSVNYLKQYLNYYLGRIDLYFDQAEALCALWYLDKDAAAEYENEWGKYVADKPGWDLEEYKRKFRMSMEYLETHQAS